VIVDSVYNADGMSPAPDIGVPGLTRTRDNEAEALGSVVLGRLREAIIAGTLTAGRRLSEVQLAKEYGVSRTPIRDALARLQSEGLVTIYPHVGAFVRTMTVDDVDEIYQLREALESLALRLLLPLMTHVGRAQLQQTLDAMRGAVEADDHERYAELLDRFHTGIIVQSGNRMLLGVFQGLMGPIRRMRRFTLRSPGRLQESLAQHVAIADALLAGDPACEERLARHLGDAAVVLKRILSVT
jgi:DNA-binding GntR family transcriptional regulator